MQVDSHNIRYWKYKGAREGLISAQRVDLGDLGDGHAHWMAVIAFSDGSEAMFYSIPGTFSSKEDVERKLSSREDLTEVSDSGVLFQRSDLGPVASYYLHLMRDGKWCWKYQLDGHDQMMYYSWLVDGIFDSEADAIKAMLASIAKAPEHWTDLRRRDDHEPSKPTWRNIYGTLFRVAYDRSKCKWGSQYRNSGDTWRFYVDRPYSLSPISDSRIEAQAALDAYGQQCSEWINLRNRQWKGHGITVFARKVDLGDGKEHWLPIATDEIGQKWVANAVLEFGHDPATQAQAESAIEVYAKKVGLVEID